MCVHVCVGGGGGCMQSSTNSEYEMAGVCEDGNEHSIPTLLWTGVHQVEEKTAYHTLRSNTVLALEVYVGFDVPLFIRFFPQNVWMFIPVQNNTYSGH